MRHDPTETGLTAADPDELRALAAVARRLPAWHAARSAAGGSVLSAFKGRGMEYDESRHYQPGDDVRYLDARVTARRGMPFTKLYREDRERPLCLCIDDRAPMHFATRGRFKRVIAARAAALAAWKACQDGNRVDALIFDDSGARWTSGGRGRAGVARVLEALSTPARAESIAAEALPDSLHAGFDHLRRRAPTGADVLLLSDFRGLNERAQRELAMLRGRRVLLLDIQDPLERELPHPRGRYRLANGLDEVVLHGGDMVERRRFDAAVAYRDTRVAELAHSLRARVLRLATTEDPSTTLRRLSGRR